MKEYTNDNLDPEMNAFLKEHFVQGTVVAMDAMRNMIMKSHKANLPHLEKLPDDFTKGFNAAYKNIAENLNKINETFPKNELKDEEHFDRLLARFEKAFPKQT